MTEMTNSKGSWSVNTLVKISIFTAMSGLLMVIFKFPLPFAPAFMTVDFGDVPALISGFALGPLAGITTVVLKNLVNLFLTGTTTAYVGELSNIIVGSTFVGVSSLIYQRNRTKKGAIIGLVVGILFMTFLATLSNYYVIFPLYAKMFKMPLDGFVKHVPAMNKFVNSFFDVMLFAVVPFNIVKGMFNSMATLAIYKYISKLIKKY